jgi:flagellin
MQVINTNVMSLNSQRSLNRSQHSMNSALERLSSGLRINRAKDDAAGMAISERFSSQIRGLNQAVRNANDGISLVQTAEGATQEIGNMLQRMRELAVQSSNETYSASDRASLNDEYHALANEIRRITDVTEFNGTTLLGSANTVSFQVGWENGANNVITVSTVDVASAGTGSVGAVISTTTHISTATKANSLIAQVDNSINKISELRADFGAVQNRLESSVRNMENVVENQSAARSRIRDADFAAETAELTRTQILQQAGVAMLAQANGLPQNVLSLLR